MKIILELTKDEAFAILEERNIAAAHNGYSDRDFKSARRKIKEAFRNPQPDEASDIEPEGRLGD